ncbi:MAG: DUF547 domain-containing protein [Myxococcota bacterium]
MRDKKPSTVVTTLLSFGLVAMADCTTDAGPPAEPKACGKVDHTHAVWTDILSTHVEDGWVDYKSLESKTRPKLQRYLDQLAGVCGSDLRGWSKEQRLAFWINAYNAFMVDLVLRNYPLQSIRKIGTLPMAAFRDNFIPIDLGNGRMMALNDIEHEILRKKFDEPRIHFGLVCASKSCPALRSEAYIAAKIDQQLDDQARQFIADASKNRVDLSSHTLHLSKIFEWFREDFEKNDTELTDFIRKYLDPKTSKALQGRPVEIQFIDYDWSLNGI